MTFKATITSFFFGSSTFVRYSCKLQGYWEYKHCALESVTGPYSLDDKEISPDMRFPTMWYVRPEKSQTGLRIRAVRSEPLLVAWVPYDC